MESLQKIGLYGKNAVIGIAKRLEENYIPGGSVPHYHDKISETLKLIQQLRDESHRFGITFHRQKRTSRNWCQNSTGVKGIGPETKKKLLAHFKSIKRLRRQIEEEIAENAEKNKAGILMNWITEEKATPRKNGKKYARQILKYEIVDTASHPRKWCN